MILVAQAQGLIWLLEQTGQSILEAHDRIRSLWRSVVAYGAFSGPYPKPHFCLTNHFGFGQGIAARLCG